MFTKKYLLALAVILSLSKGNAQTIERQIINSMGTMLSSSGLSMKTSIGEPVVGKIGNGHTMLSQGFYTGSYEIIFSSSPMIQQNTNITLYPNPADNIIFLEGDLSKIFSVEIFNSLGMKIFSEQLNSSQIDLKNIAAGIYILQLRGANHEIISSTKFIKAQL